MNKIKKWIEENLRGPQGYRGYPGPMGAKGDDTFQEVRERGYKGSREDFYIDLVKLLEK